MLIPSPSVGEEQILDGNIQVKLQRQEKFQQQKLVLETIFTSYDKRNWPKSLGRFEGRVWRFGIEWGVTEFGEFTRRDPNQSNLEGWVGGS